MSLSGIRMFINRSYFLFVVKKRFGNSNFQGILYYVEFIRPLYPAQYLLKKKLPQSNYPFLLQIQLLFVPIIFQ